MSTPLECSGSEDLAQALAAAALVLEWVAVELPQALASAPVSTDRQTIPVRRERRNAHNLHVRQAAGAFCEHCARRQPKAAFASYFLIACACTIRFISITVTQLRAFLAVVRGGSVTAAADELIVTQPSVSSALSALSRELDCELLERWGRGVRLTAAGKAFAPYAADVLGLLEKGSAAASQAAGLAARTLQIAAVTTAAESFVPPLLRAFSQRDPGVELTLVVGNRHQVLERVLDHSVDIAISGKPPANERLVFEPLLDNVITCITAPDDPLAGHRIEAARLADRVWLLREPGSGTRTLNEQFLSDRGLRPATLTLGSNGAIKQAARAGLGVSLLSRGAAAAELELGLLGELALRDGPVRRSWYLLRSAIGPMRPSVESFVAFMLSHAGPGEPRGIAPA